MTPEMPFTDVPERTRTVTTYYEGTDQVHVTGEYVNGLKEGSWKEYWPNGQLKQDYEWKRGLKHGHELDWAENGTQICEGRNERHVRVGTWTWWHDNGRYKQAYHYDEDGEKHGEYVWNQEDGSPRARGEFWHGKFDGQWEWHDEPNHERIVRGYLKGAHHGEDAGWYPGGQLAYRRHYYRGKKHGDEETYYENGEPKFRGSWNYGTPIGDHHEWDEEGHETVTTYVNGFAEGGLPDDEKLARLVTKLGKADDSYAKEDALDQVVDWGERSALVYHLWKAGLYDVPRDRELWRVLIDYGTGLFSGEDVVEFLETATNGNVWGGHLPYWARAMDRLVMSVYERDPDPIDAAWEELPTKNRKGVAFVRARFGKDVGDALNSELPALAKRHAEQHGLSDRILWPNEDGVVEEQRIFEMPSYEPTEYFDRLLALFGTPEQWREMLEPYALAEADETVSRVSFTTFRPVIEAASTDQMKTLCAGIALDGFTHQRLHDALWDWRGDDGKTMTEIALGIEDTGLCKWPVVCAAMLKLHEEGEEIPDELVQCFELDAETPTYSTQWYTTPVSALPDEFQTDPNYLAEYVDIAPGTSVPRSQPIQAALRLLDEEQIRSIFEGYLETDYYKLRPTQFLYLLDDPELWERFIRLAEDDGNGHHPRVTWGFGYIGLEVVGLLEDAVERADTSQKEQGWRQAIICALAHAAAAGEEIPERNDEHVRFDTTDDYYFQFLMPFLERIIHLLPADRAEKVLLRELDRSYWRALRMIASHPGRAVLEKAFGTFLEKEKTMSYAQGQQLTFALKGLSNTEDWVRWILANGGGAQCKDALKSAIGWQRFEELEKELADEGVEPAKELDHIDRVLQLAGEAGSTSGEKFYLLRRLGDTPTEDLNVIGGPAPGVTEERWPTRDDEPMEHLFTLDLDTMPELKTRYECRAMSVFCYQPGHNKAWAPGNDWTAIVFTTQEQIDAGGDIPEEMPPEPEAWFQPVAVHLASPSHTELRNAIYGAGARVGGYPNWIQSEDYWGDFVMEFNESFAHMNLGDMGTMYVFSDTAFWQCY